MGGDWVKYVLWVVENQADVKTPALFSERRGAAGVV